jgi:post-segregation antitoxin (ccd killing protein)
MTMIEISLPDELARRAKSAGLLSDAAIQHLLEDAIRRWAGRALVDVARHIQEAGIPPMTMEQVDAEVKAVRAERRARSAAHDQSPANDPEGDAIGP